MLLGQCIRELLPGYRASWRYLDSYVIVGVHGTLTTGCVQYAIL